jgi:hypothetical protein
MSRVNRSKHEQQIELSSLFYEWTRRVPANTVFSFIRFSINVLTRSNAAASLSLDKLFSLPHPKISVSV